MLVILALLAGVYAHPEQLVDTDWVAAHARTRTSASSTCGRTDTPTATCPAACTVSPVAIRDAKAPPTFLPTPQAFEDLMAKLGIGDATRVVVYDERGGICTPRGCGGF